MGLNYAGEEGDAKGKKMIQKQQQSIQLVQGKHETRFNRSIFLNMNYRLLTIRIENK